MQNEDWHSNFKVPGLENLPTANVDKDNEEKNRVFMVDFIWWI